MKAVIFDMDGVLIDSEPGHLIQEERLFQSLGISLDKEGHNKFVGTTTQYMWNILKKDFNLKNTIDELIALDRNEYYEFLTKEEKVVPIDGIPELIKNLKSSGIKIAVASSSPLKVIEYILNTFKLYNYFDQIVTGDYVKRSKPNPDVFLYASQRLDMAPKDCIVVEDSHNGVMAAKNANMTCVGFRNPHSGIQDLSMADIIIDSFKNINTEKLMKL